VYRYVYRSGYCVGGSRTGTPGVITGVPGGKGPFGLAQALDSGG